MIPEIRVGEEAMRRLWLVEVGVEGVVVPVLDSEVLTGGARDASPNPGSRDRRVSAGHTLPTPRPPPTLEWSSGSRSQSRPLWVPPRQRWYL